MTTATHAQPKTDSVDAVRSLSRFNARLNALSIPSLVESGHSQFLSTGNLGRMARAIEVADTQPEAVTYIIKTLLDFRPVVAGTTPPNHPSAPPAQPPSRVTNMADHRRQPPAPQAPAAEQERHTSEPPPGDRESTPDAGYEDEGPVPDGNQRPTRPMRDGSQREYINVHVYGGKAALCFSADETKHGVQTISIDAAPCVGERTYNWDNKVTIQLTAAELPHVASVILGLAPGCEYSNHGPDHKKGFKMENQPGKVFVQVRGPGVSHAVPITLADIWRVGNLFARQLRKGNPHLSSGSDVLNMLRATVVRLLPANRPAGG